MAATISGGVITEDTNLVKGYQPQGFTMNANTGKCFVARLKGNVDNQVVLTRVVHFGTDKGKIDKTNPTEANKFLSLGHANNMAYFDGRIYIVTGEKTVVSYATDLSSKKTHSVVGKTGLDISNYTALTSISYIGSEWFLLGQGLKCATAWFDGSKFIIVTKFNLENVDSKVERSDTVKVSRQGCFVDGWALYRPHSLHTVENKVIKKNAIVSYALTGTYPSYTGAAYVSHFTCDNTNLAFFEVEAVSKYNGNFYISTATKTSDGGAIQNRIYKITF